MHCCHYLYFKLHVHGHKLLIQVVYGCRLCTLVLEDTLAANVLTHWIPGSGDSRIKKVGGQCGAKEKVGGPT